jgi:hypothetical protein
MNNKNDTINNLIRKSVGRAPSLRVTPWHLPYNWGKSTENPQMEVGGQRHGPAVLPPEKTRYLLYRRLGGPQVQA